jgi:hypothetical protein
MIDFRRSRMSKLDRRVGLTKKWCTRAVFLLLLTILPVSPLIAQDEGGEGGAEQQAIYSLGQQTLSISAGLFIPLFYQAFTGEYSGTTGLKLGGVGSLQWGIHLDNNWLLGLEVGGMFSPSRDIPENVFYQLPITAKGAYIFHLFPFEISVYLGAGMDIVKYADQTQVNFILKPGFMPLWKYNTEWGFGLNVVYWWVFQPWNDDRVGGREAGRMGNFLELTATAQYNF